VPASAAAIVREVAASRLGEGRPLFRVGFDESVAGTDEGGPDVNNLFGADPRTDHRNWQGLADKSVEAYLGIDGDDLIMRFDATDDRHVAKAGIREWWTNDGVQVALVGDGRSEFGIVLADGNAKVHRVAGPASFTLASVDADAERRRETTTYRVTIPLTHLGISRDDLARGVPFSFIANENDGEGRDFFLKLSDGIGGQKESTDFPLIRLQ